MIIRTILWTFLALSSPFSFAAATTSVEATYAASGFKKFSSFSTWLQMQDYLSNYVGQTDKDEFMKQFPLPTSPKIPKVQLNGTEFRIWLSDEATVITLVNATEKEFSINGKPFRFYPKKTFLENMDNLDKVLSANTTSRFDYFLPKAEAAQFGPQFRFVGGAIINTVVDAVHQTELAANRKVLDDMNNLCEPELSETTAANPDAPLRGIDKNILANISLVRDAYHCSALQQLGNWESLAQLGYESFRDVCTRFRKFESCINKIEAKTKKGYHISAGFESQLNVYFQQLGLVKGIQPINPPASAVN